MNQLNYRKKSQQGVTLMEFMVVLLFLSIMITGVVLNNVKKSAQKSRDLQRKNDLQKIVKILEEYYNDHGRYPEYDRMTGFMDHTAWGAPFPPYTSKLPKDPLGDSHQRYYYHSDESYPHWYALYAQLENTGDPEIAALGCQEGCGVSWMYNYAVLSSNVHLINRVPNLN